MLTRHSPRILERMYSCKSFIEKELYALNHDTERALFSLQTDETMRGIRLTPDHGRWRRRPWWLPAAWQPQPEADTFLDTPASSVSCLFGQKKVSAILECHVHHGSICILPVHANKVSDLLECHVQNGSVSCLFGHKKSVRLIGISCISWLDSTDNLWDRWTQNWTPYHMQ